MKRHHAYVVLAGASLASVATLVACNVAVDPVFVPEEAGSTLDSGTSSDGSAEPGPPVVGKPGCAAAGAASEVVLACGLPPILAVLGATTRHVVLADGTDGALRIHRYDRASTVVDLIAKETDTFFTFPNEAAAGTGRGFAYVASDESVVYRANAPGAPLGLQARLRKVSIASGEPSTLAEVGRIYHLLVADARVYFESDLPTDGGPYKTGIRAVASAGGPVVTVVDDGDFKVRAPVGVAAGYLYYAQRDTDATLYRVPLAGGPKEILAEHLDGLETHFAIDSDGAAYFARRPATRGWGFEVVRISGATRTTVVECTDAAYCDDPLWLEARASEVVVGQKDAFIHAPKSGTTTLTSAAALAARVAAGGVTKGRPWFEKGWVLHAYARGSEGIVTARPSAIDP